MVEKSVAATEMDYLKWRGDLSFAADPFNEVDNLVLCTIAYLNDVYGEEDLLAFTLDGVSAKPENVASGDYPLGTKGYVVIRADEAKNSPARRLYDWFGSTICDEILNNNGVTPLHE